MDSSLQISFGPAPEAALLAAEFDRRARMRYPVELKVHYHTLRKKRPQAGVGYTRNVSTDGLLIESPNELTLGALVEVSIEWPYLLNGEIPLQLAAVGKVVRCKESSFAMHLQKHEFRTMKRSTGTGLHLTASTLA